MNAQRVVAGIWAGACVCALSACSGSTGPGFPPIQGTYGTNFAFTFNNAANSQQNGTFQVSGTMSINRPAQDGSFVGSYIFGGGVNGSGSIAGVIDRQGNVLMDEFGDPGAPPMVELQFLQTQWSNCDFSRVTTGGMTGALAANTLSLTGTLGFNCDYTNGSQVTTFPTTLTEQVDGVK